jgi:hypothetical protein
MFLASGVAIALVLMASACGEQSPRSYDGRATAACLKSRPEYRRPLTELPSIDVSGDRYAPPSTPITNFVDAYYDGEQTPESANPVTTLDGHDVDFARAWLTFYGSWKEANETYRFTRAYYTRLNAHRPPNAPRPHARMSAGELERAVFQRKNAAIESAGALPLPVRFIEILDACLSSRP